MSTNLKLSDLVKVVEQDAKGRGKLPRNPEQAMLGYYYAYGKLLEELENVWQWDTRQGRGRFYRGRVEKALGMLLRSYLLTRSAGPLRGVGGDILAIPGADRDVVPSKTCLIHLHEISVMLQRPHLFLHYLWSMCQHYQISYTFLIYSLSKQEEKV